MLNIVASTQSLSRLSIPRLRSSPVKCRNIRLVALLLLKNHEPSLYVAPIASDGEYHAAALSVRLPDATGPLLMNSSLTYLSKKNSAGKRSARLYLNSDGQALIETVNENPDRRGGKESQINAEVILDVAPCCRHIFGIDMSCTSRSKCQSLHCQSCVGACFQRASIKIPSKLGQGSFVLHEER